MTEVERREMIAVMAGFVAVMAERQQALVSRLEQNLSTANAAMAEASKDPFVKGSTGQLTEHPGFRIAARCDELTLRLYAAITAGQDELTEMIAGGLRGEVGK